MPIIFDQPFQILLNLARDEKIDPWDVDIDKVADLYVQKIREMERLDLRVTGRALSSASILLRMKADSPPYSSEREEEDEFVEEVNFDMPELGPITLIRQSHQKITLSDLTGSLQEALEEPKEEPKRERERTTVENVMRKLDDYHINIEEHIQEFHEKITLLASDGNINFMEILPKKNKTEIARNLLLALFLSSKGKISLHQEEHFGDIYIELLEPAEVNYGN